MEDEDDEYKVLSKKNLTLSVDQTSSGLWNKRQIIKWNITLFFGCFLLYSSRTSMSICSVEIAKEYGWDKSSTGMVMSAFFFGYILTQIIGGILSDRFGGERVLFLSAGAWSLSTFIIPFVEILVPVNFGFIALRIVTGASQGFYFPALASLVSKKIDANSRNSAYSFAASGTSMGSIFSGLVGSLLLDYHGWRSVFFLIGSLCIMWVLLLKVFIHQDFSYDSKIVIHKSVGSLKWKTLTTRKPFWALIFCSTCESLVFTILLSWVPTYFHDVFPQSQGWLFNVTPWVASFFVENTCGIISDKMLTKGCSCTKVRKLFVSLAFFPPVIFCNILNRATSFEWGLCLMTMIIGGMGANSSGIGMNPQDLAPNHAGSVFGVVNTLGAVSGMVGVYFTGRILDATKDWSVIFQLASFVSLFGANHQILARHPTKNFLAVKQSQLINEVQAEELVAQLKYLDLDQYTKFED